MSMNNIVFYFICLLIIPPFSYAEDSLSVACKDFRSVLDDAESNLVQIQEIPF